MDQSPLGNVLGHLAQMAEQQGQLHQAQNEVLAELAQSLAADRAMLRELLAAGGRGEGPRGAGPATQIHVPKMGEADDPEAFLQTFQGVAEVSGWSPAAPDRRGTARGPQPAGRGPARL